MNDSELTFNGLVKLNTQRPSFGNEPLLSQVREIYENGLVFKWAKTSVCYPLLTRKNKKEALTSQGGKIKGKGNGFHFVLWQYSTVHL